MGLLNRLRRRPAIDERDDLFAYWRSRTTDTGENRISDYAQRTGRSEALALLIDDLPRDARILEIGCNVGRNLAYLFDKGWHNVEGIEINANSVEFLRGHYTQLADRPIYLGAAEEVLPTLERPYDLVFTMAVLEHIHPDSTVVFDEMVRLGRSVLAIEPKGNATHRQHPHDIMEIFTTRGMIRDCVRPMASIPFQPTEGFTGTRDDRALRDYHAWRFSHQVSAE